MYTNIQELYTNIQDIGTFKNIRVKISFYIKKKIMNRIKYDFFYGGGGVGLNLDQISLNS